jgi:uncharacterized protein (TIGR00297 family)
MDDVWGTGGTGDTGDTGDTGGTGDTGDTGDTGIAGSGAAAGARQVSPEEEEVDKLLSKAQAAVIEAEKTVERIEDLPSARLPTGLGTLTKMAQPAFKVALLVAYCWAMHSFGLVVRLGGGLLLAGAVGLRGYRDLSLSPSGAIAAAVVGWSTLSSSFRAGLVLLGFFYVSSALTRFGDEDKDVEEGHKKGGQRNWVQVYSNGAVPAILATSAAVISAGKDLAILPVSSSPLYSVLTAAFLGYIACCAGDTWSSEIGQLSDSEPRLITTLRPVRKGTNGGVTLLGLLSSCLGGLFVGILFYITGGSYQSQWKVVPLGMGAGLLGSLVDSVLGATVQFTGYNRKTGKITGTRGPDVSPISGSPLLDNNGVNVLSATVTSAVTAAVAFALGCM